MPKVRAAKAHPIAEAAYAVYELANAHSLLHAVILAALLVAVVVHLFATEH